MMYLALTYDHRILDGREAVIFLVKVWHTKHIIWALVAKLSAADQGIYRRPSSHASWLNVSTDTVAQLSSRTKKMGRFLLLLLLAFSFLFSFFVDYRYVHAKYISHFECFLDASVGRGPFSRLVALLSDYYILGFRCRLCFLPCHFIFLCIPCNVHNVSSNSHSNF